MQRVWTKEVVLASLINLIENGDDLRVLSQPSGLGKRAIAYFGTWGEALEKAAEAAGTEAAKSKVEAYLLTTGRGGTKTKRAAAKAVKERGAALRKARKKLGLSQRKLGLRIGFHDSTIANWETGRALVSEEVLEQVEAWAAAGEAPPAGAVLFTTRKNGVEEEGVPLQLCADRGPVRAALEALDKDRSITINGVRYTRTA